MGRPTVYNEKFVDEFCRRLIEGESTRSICASPGMPSRAIVFVWLSDGKHQELVERYEQAKRIRAEIIVEDLLEIADDSSADYVEGEDGKRYLNAEHVARSRLRVDTRKWYVGKCLPKIYGDSIRQDVTVTNRTAMVVDEEHAERVAKEVIERARA